MQSVLSESDADVASEMNYWVGISCHRRSCMYTAVLMLAMTTSADLAEHGGLRGGCYGCSGYAGSGCYGGCYRGGCYGGGCYGCCGGGGYYRAGYYSPGYGYAYMPSGYYYGPGTIVQSNGTQVRQSFYQGPGQQNTAMVQVLVPNPDTEIWFDGNATQQRGSERFFQSPPLEPNASYNYTIKAHWMENGKKIEQERKV